jgi:nucleoside-diphosphate-sugar epimerase
MRALDAKEIFTVFNVGAGDRVTVKELIATIGQLTDKEPKIDFTEVRKGDIPHSYADIEKARVEIGYVPKVKLREGLEKTIAYYKTVI